MHVPPRGLSVDSGRGPLMEALVLLYLLAVVPCGFTLVAMGWIASNAPPVKPPRPTLRLRSPLANPAPRARRPAKRRIDTDDDLGLFGEET